MFAVKSIIIGASFGIPLMIIFWKGKMAAVRGAHDIVARKKVAFLTNSKLFGGIFLL